MKILFGEACMVQTRSWPRGGAVTFFANAAPTAPQVHHVLSAFVRSCSAGGERKFNKSLTKAWPAKGFTWAKAHSYLLVIRWLKPTAIKGKSISFPFIAVPFMGRIIEAFDGFSQKRSSEHL